MSYLDSVAHLGLLAPLVIYSSNVSVIPYLLHSSGIYCLVKHILIKNTSTTVSVVFFCSNVCPEYGYILGPKKTQDRTSVTCQEEICVNIQITTHTDFE